MKPCNSAPPPPEKTSKSNEIKQALLVARSGYPCFQPFMVNGSFFKKLPNQLGFGMPRFLLSWFVIVSPTITVGLWSRQKSSLAMFALF